MERAFHAHRVDGDSAHAVTYRADRRRGSFQLTKKIHAPSSPAPEGRRAAKRLMSAHPGRDFYKSRAQRHSTVPELLSCIRGFGGRRCINGIMPTLHTGFKYFRERSNKFIDATWFARGGLVFFKKRA